MVRLCKIICIIFVQFLIIKAAQAGVVNPDISAIGQVLYSAESGQKAAFNLGETELILDGAFNPYAKGGFVFSIGDSGLEIEEAYINIIRGLPDGLEIKAGKYRIGFGKMNPVHPHVYSFIEAPRVISVMLPGDDGFNDVGTQVSYLLPTFGSWASILSADVLRGASFHTDPNDPDNSNSMAGWVAHWSNSLLIDDTTPLEIGASATQGMNNVQWRTRERVYGADVKTKIPFSSLTILTLQSEYFYNNSGVINNYATGSFDAIGRQGFYALTDLKFWQRYNAGAIYDQYNPRGNRAIVDRAVKCFAGFSFLEETTLLRLAYEQFLPQDSPVVHTVTFQILYSIGPHKAHQF